MKSLKKYSIFFLLMASHFVYAVGEKPVYQQLDAKNIKLSEQLNLLKKTLDIELNAENFNPNNLDLIFKLNGQIVKADNFGAEIISKKDRFSFNDYNSCECNAPDFLNYSCDGSFLGRARLAWCQQNTDEDACFALFCCLPFYTLQAFVGCCLPCGYNKNCCWREIDETAKRNTDIKAYLNTLKIFYESEHWNTYATTQSE